MSIYRNYGKRLLDVICAITGLILLAPLLLVAALAVKCTSKGPAFFGQERIGKDGIPFKIWKFRSMVSNADKIGPLITASGDSRITPIGRLLRQSKIDELPQFWNVLTGDMSFVGPRPELPFYVRDYTPEQRQVLAVRPGITDPAALEYRHEEAILAKATDRERFYRDVLLPHKLSMNLEYIRKLSFRYDLALILRTAGAIFRRSGPATAISEGRDEKSENC
ncbi:MAG TPA: sugar transferase [Candidatus Angelobacter sp.]|nr:sugar transferase [Candidatus Angelobacter sp.]